MYTSHGHGPIIKFENYWILIRQTRHLRRAKVLTKIVEIDKISLRENPYC